MKPYQGGEDLCVVYWARYNDDLCVVNADATLATLYVVNAHVMLLCILFLKSTHKNSLQKTNKYRLFDATLTPEDQIWSLTVVTTATATTYSDEV